MDALTGANQQKQTGLYPVCIQSTTTLERKRASLPFAHTLRRQILIFTKK